jgi:hypothetical protein
MVAGEAGPVFSFPLYIVSIDLLMPYKTHADTSDVVAIEAAS